jgi:transposase
MRHLNRQLAYSDETIERVAAHDAPVQRLRTVLSVGPVTAVAFGATLDDVQRFRHAHQVEAYLGLVPRQLSSGDRQHRGSITKASPGRPRWLLIQAAVSILRRRPPETEALRAWALRIPPAAGSRSPSSRSRAAWPGSSMRSSAMARSSSHAGPLSLCPPPRSQAARKSEQSTETL